MKIAIFAITTPADKIDVDCLFNSMPTACLFLCRIWDPIGLPIEWVSLGCGFVCTLDVSG